MATKYHINQSTGEYGECKAEKRGCPLGDAVIHMENLSNVVEYSDLIMKEKYGSFTPLKKSRKIPQAKDITLTPNDRYPYPQAHTLSKIDEITFSLKGGNVSPEIVQNVIGSTDRVSYYYADAVCYLGLAEAVTNDNGHKSFTLTQAGQDYISQDKEGREDILKRSISNIDLVQNIQQNSTNEEVLNQISEHNKENHESAKRKLDSVKSWITQIEKDNFLNDVRSDDVEEKVAQAWEIYEKKEKDNPAPKEKFGEICQTCFTAKSLTGVCDNCDE